MGVFLGLLLGVGSFLCLMSGLPSTPRSAPFAARIQAWLPEAGASTLRPIHLLLLSFGGALVVAAVVLLATSTWSLALVFGVFGGAGPSVVLRRRITRTRRERRELWPYVVDDLASGIRAGLSLPEAVAAVAERGPEPLRPAFATFASGYRASGSFTSSLQRLGDDLGDPIADRVIEALALARDVGGTDVGRLLRSLSHAIREDARARGEIEARQSWTVNGARLAVAAPWAVLLLLATRGSGIRVYDKPAGLLVLTIGGLLCALAYALMQRIGRLPAERRSSGPTG